MSALPRHIREKISKATVTEDAFQESLKILKEADKVFVGAYSGLDNRSSDVALCIARMIVAYEQDLEVKRAIGEINITSPIWLFTEAMIQTGRG